MTKFEKGFIISVIIIMFGIFISILCLMFNHYHEIKNDPIIVVSKKESIVNEVLEFYESYVYYIIKNNQITNVIENRMNKISYKTEIDLEEAKRKLKSTALSSGPIVVEIEKETYYVSEDNKVLLELLQSIGKENYLAKEKQN